VIVAGGARHGQTEEAAGFAPWLSRR
jgi:hypothetical protein